MPKRILTGKVVSDKMQKTRVIAISSTKQHPVYGKVMKRTKRYKFHDESNETKVGDLVEIVESRPLSKQKNWTLSKVIEKAEEGL